jgi:hypothetical protein
MQPVNNLWRQIVLILVSAGIGWLVRRNVLSIANADTLRPLIVDTIIYNLPLLLPAVTNFSYQIYNQFVYRRLFGTARVLPAGATENEVIKTALGKGGKRAAAKVLLGIK